MHENERILAWIEFSRTGVGKHLLIVDAEIHDARSEAATRWDALMA